MALTGIRREPCTFCPYRQDCPSGVWSAEEYDKLPPYDRFTGEQPVEAFACHVSTDRACHGWARVGTSQPHERDLLALRLPWYSDLEIPDEIVPLFETHTDAAEHGRMDLDDPSPEALDAMQRLLRKYPRLTADESGEPMP